LIDIILSEPAAVGPGDAGLELPALSPQDDLSAATDRADSGIDAVDDFHTLGDFEG
jgi:hypothetical protein